MAAFCLKLLLAVVSLVHAARVEDSLGSWPCGAERLDWAYAGKDGKKRIAKSYLKRVPVEIAALNTVIKATESELSRLTKRREENYYTLQQWKTQNLTPLRDALAKMEADKEKCEKALAELR
mmetsp:Transcript_91256/g.212279  ORF Transcript_91256/g.212279 Transcript_91256/m.212279 type:complete len:122 (-) Transcript_91256:99-464(-)|eukprot:CAMPEP_0171086046 /NCGR_PEP_ID=MMETSP0766_2-20121228/19299_1 /TAXON_ID=439317 /ORGANISM="Gambierdiscus australes, Strain CAWD 149" /LENGTH=121 /DNA_ID=CAMNT_0011543653 /DNA_START=50 /DNA_END=415 /DNA_ORIENTATION=-